MAPRRSIKWLHRIGYVTTAVVAAELLALGGLIYNAWKQDREASAYQMQQTRTHLGPLKVEEVRYYRPDELDLMATLPPLQSEGLRFAAMPSLRGPWFAVSVAVQSKTKRAAGLIKIFSQPRGDREGLEIIRSISFDTSTTAADQLISRAQSLTANWKGERSHCLDGTTVAFEIAQRGTVISGRGNSACNKHYANLSLLIIDAISGLIPSDIRPVDQGWRPRQEHTR